MKWLRSKPTLAAAWSDWRPPRCGPGRQDGHRDLHAAEDRGGARQRDFTYAMSQMPPAPD